jgi:MSHA pilin protein MshD
MFNTGQTMLVLGALVIFSLLLPSLNSSLLYSDRTVTSTNAELTAISLAQKILAEASTKVFDVVCLTSHPTHATSMTAVASLGRETGETYPNYNDVDDYKNLALVDSTSLPSVRFTITASCDYVDPDHPADVSANPTFVKRLRVTVTGPFLINPMTDAPLSISTEQLFAYY